MDALFNRRSIRQYTADPVSDEEIRFILDAAMRAPSAGNEQPWQFIIVKDPEIINEIPNVHPYAGMVRQAPAVILVCGDLNLVKHGEMWIQDCAAATQNLLLAVTTKGLGAVWLGVYPREERITGLRKLLELPDHVVPFALVPVGRPKEKKGPEDRYRADRVHQNKWGG